MIHFHSVSLQGKLRAFVVPAHSHNFLLLLFIPNAKKVCLLILTSAGMGLDQITNIVASISSFTLEESKIVVRDTHGLKLALCPIYIPFPESSRKILLYRIGRLYGR